jgi:hypothetical protein
MITKFGLGLITLVTAALLPAAAFAEGAVKVECWGRCDLVNLGQICDTYLSGSQPVALACDDTAIGSGVNKTCGGGMTCRPWGSLLRSDPLSAYCDDGPGYDAVVTCRAAGASSAAAAIQEPASSKQDDGAGQDDRQ